LTDVAAQFVELPGDGGDRTRIDVHDGSHRQECVCQMAQYGWISPALFDVALDSVEDRDDLALAIRVEP
jgi:hypothetical protein